MTATEAKPLIHDNSILRIESQKGFVSLHVKELWEYRELLYFLIWRDVKVRYKQTALGAAWAVIQPLMTMIVFTIFFGRLAKMPSDGIPYSLFTFSALVPWTFFANGLLQSSNSLVGSSNLITKVYFPRLHVPLASVLSGGVDAAIATLVLGVLMLAYRIKPGIHILWIPAFALLTVIVALGVGLWLSALNVQFRDVRYIVPFLIQLWMFATPIAYPSSQLSERWRMIYSLNPMVGVVEGFRWALFGTKMPGVMILVSSAATFLILLGGAYYFRRMEGTFADIV
jgi:lipopolysaccharide transport system permease protein